MKKFKSAHLPVAQKRNRKSGQSLIEFIFVSVFFIFMLAITYQAVIAFTIHQYLYYVSFMAARAYQAAGENPTDQRQRAYDTLRAFLPVKSLASTGLGADRRIELPDSAASDLVFEHFGRVGRIEAVWVPVPRPGVDYGAGAVVDRASGGQQDNWVGIKIRMPFVTLPLGSNLRTEYGFLSLAAQSYLGREVTRSECRSYFLKFSTLGANPNEMEDQGC